MNDAQLLAKKMEINYQLKIGFTYFPKLLKQTIQRIKAIL
jgi:hypothetical protein